MSRRDGRRGRRAATGGGVTVRTSGDAAQLLPMAVHHHEAGHLSRARALYEQIIAADPEHADGLQYFGILCHQSGDPVRAEELIRRAINLKPHVAPYHDNLGTVLEGAGRLQDALAAYRAAEALEPGDPDRGYNMGVVLERLARPADAEACYRRALEARPADVQSRFGLGNALKQRGDAAGAEAAYRQVLEAQPAHAPARVNLGNLLQAGGRLEEAEAAYRAALESAPQDATAHHNLGRVLRRLGRVEEALTCFERALANDADLDDARMGLAQVLEDTGRLDRALAAYRAASQVAAIRDDAVAGLLRVARLAPPRRHDPALADALVAAVASGRVPAAALARAMGLQLADRVGLLRAPTGGAGDALERAIARAVDPLFGCLLERTANVVPEVERWLVAVRRALLLTPRGLDPECVPVLRAVALQGVHNEYVMAVDVEEQRAVDALRESLEQWLAGDAPAPPALEAQLARLACYAPLASLAHAGALTEDGAARWSDWLQPLLEQTLLWPLEERTQAVSLPALAEITDPASVLVREQYEENPYPRWTELPAGRGATPAGDPAARVLSAGVPRDVLVAGCGTGQEPLALASRFPGHRVVALDLSRASLAYGARMAERLGIQGVEFVHGDLLQAGRLGRRFHLVTATGVLHHMADPVAGWRALARCLAPGGVMKVGLYSRAARAPVNAARERIAGLGLAASADGVRALRRRVLDGGEPALEPLLDSEDFFATSPCRDLLFHVLEHQFDLGQVRTMLESLELRFLGLELPHPLVGRRFAASGAGDALDLDAWSRYEAAHPDTFEAMYRLWCDRPGDTQGVGDA